MSMDMLNISKRLVTARKKEIVLGNFNVDCIFPMRVHKAIARTIPAKMIINMPLRLQIINIAVTNAENVNQLENFNLFAL